MMQFLELEGGYLVIGLFILAVTAFVTTRPFVANGQAWKKGIPMVLFILSGFILAHYFTTTSRMADVQAQFANNKPVICESKEYRKGASSLIIDPTKPQGWYLKDDIFYSPEYTRGFHSARCLPYNDLINTNSTPNK